VVHDILFGSLRGGRDGRQHSWRYPDVRSRGKLRQVDRVGKLQPLRGFVAACLDFGRRVVVGLVSVAEGTARERRLFSVCILKCLEEQ